MAKYFTSDLLIGQKSSSDNPLIYTGTPPAMVEQRFLHECTKRIKPDDELYLIGNLICELDDLKFYNQLPECHLYIMCGDKEWQSPNFAEVAEEILRNRPGCLDIYFGVHDVMIGTMSWRMAHDPRLLLGYSQLKPSICGSVHNLWTLKKASSGLPVLNVSFDAWGYGLLSENTIIKIYRKFLQGHFDQFIHCPT